MDRFGPDNLSTLQIKGHVLHRHDINKLNFNRNTKFSNLSSEERAALENLSKRKDLIVKAADKVGALVVWWADLYQKEALRQLCDHHHHHHHHHFITN